MGQPTPPGDNIPLIEGLDPSWNDFVSKIPEDLRGELGPQLKERVTGIESKYEPLRQWEDFSKQGYTPDTAKTALDVYKVLENNPREVYDTIGKHLGITPAQAQAVIEDLEENGESEDPRIARLQQQVETMSQIMLSQREQETQAQQAAEAEKQIEKEISEVKKKYGDDIPEDQIIMRMLHKGMSADDAAKEYISFVDEVRARRPAPFVLGKGTGQIPAKQIDVTKLGSKETKNVVAQMLQHARNEA